MNMKFRVTGKLPRNLKKMAELKLVSILIIPLERTIRLIGNLTFLISSLTVIFLHLPIINCFLPTFGIINSGPKISFLLTF